MLARTSFFMQSRATARRFRKCAHGGPATLFAVALVPTIAALGATIDYARSASMRTSMSRAADAAALAAAKHKNGTKDEREKVAKRIFQANLGDKLSYINGVKVAVTDIEGGVRVEVAAKFKNSFISMMGKNNTKLVTSAEAIVNSGSVEVALVLDNTGSMRNDMASLRAAATNFVDIVLGPSDGSVRVSVVPYNAAVNPGVKNLPMSMMDTAGNSKWHGEFLEGQYAGYNHRCRLDDREKEAEEAAKPQPVSVDPVSDPEPDPEPDPGSDPGGGGGGGGGGGWSGPSGPGKSGGKDKETFLQRSGEMLRQFAGVLTEIAGVTPAHAQVTPNTYTPLSGTWYDKPALKAAAPNAFVPTGWTLDGECLLKTPSKISHFDLFNRIPGAKWKGCVEARPDPYDVTDAPPSAFTPDTMFVPYFWPDEPDDYKGSRFNYNNSYLEDGAYDQYGQPNKKYKHPLIGWDESQDEQTHSWDDDERMLNLFKYDGRTPAKIKENGPVTEGPNMACPDEILPLTTDAKVAKAKIANLRHWFGGGTVTSEGVAWGWRTLSPEAPFTEGLPYDPANKKFIVLMTDGLNGLAENAPDWGSMTWSDYSAYGYMSSDRHNIKTFDDMTSFLNERQDKVCTNAKAKGITIFTILFRENSQLAIDSTRKCASDGKFFYHAVNAYELDRAFSDIGGRISKLRLSR